MQPPSVLDKWQFSLPHVYTPSRIWAWLIHNSHQEQQVYMYTYIPVNVNKLITWFKVEKYNLEIYFNQTNIFALVLFQLAVASSNMYDGNHTFPNPANMYAIDRMPINTIDSPGLPRKNNKIIIIIVKILVARCKCKSYHYIIGADCLI